MGAVATFRVSPTGRRAYRSISAALQAAYSRNKPVCIEIDSGHYVDPLMLRGATELKATGPPGSVVIETPPQARNSTAGKITLSGITLVNHTTDLISHEAGTLHLQRCRLQASNGASVHAGTGTGLTLQECDVHSGRISVVGAQADLQGSRFVDAHDNAIAVFSNARARINGCTITGNRQHGIRVVTAQAVITDSDLSRAGYDAITVEQQAEAFIQNCHVHDVDAGAISYTKQARGKVDNIRISDALTGIAVATHADPIVHNCVLDRCRDAGIDVNNKGRGKFEDCQISQPQQVGFIAQTQAAPIIRRCRISDGNIGTAAVSARPHMEDMTFAELSVALRARKGSTLKAERVEVDRCDVGIHTDGDSGQATITHAQLRQPRRLGVSIEGTAQLTLSDSSVSSPGIAGFACTEGNTLITRHTAVTDAGVGGAVATGKATIRAEQLRITDSEEYGVAGREDAHLDLTACEITGNGADLHTQDRCTGQVADCTFTPNQPGTVTNEGRVRLADAPAHTPSPTSQRNSTAATPTDYSEQLPSNEPYRDTSPLDELHQLIGLTPVKEQVQTQINLVRVAEQRRAHSLPTSSTSRHLVFSGPPGTGKTTVARLYGRILADLGTLSTGGVTEASRSDLVGKHLGETSDKTQKLFDSARGGVLFIDEAYTLSRRFGIGSDFGQEAIDVLIKLMEDLREEVVVVAAGYTDEMETFLASNPGLRSRFSRTIEFPRTSPTSCNRSLS